MHKNYLTTIFWLFTLTIANAQVTDTLGFQTYSQGTSTTYASPNGGFAFGNNGYEDRAKAQTFFHDKSFVLRKVLLKFGAVSYTSNNDSSSIIRINIYNNFGSGITTTGAIDSIAPSEIRASFDILISEIMSGSVFTEVDFSASQLVITDRFSVGIDVTFLAPGDTVGLESTTDGDAALRQNSWEQTANGGWITILNTNSWDLDVDLAIFPVIDEDDPAGIEENNASIAVYPNPTDGLFAAQLPFYGEWHAEIFASDGRLIMRQIEMTDLLRFNLNDFLSGLYILRLSNGQTNRLSRIVLR